jgi:hypothetical protein
MQFTDQLIQEIELTSKNYTDILEYKKKLMEQLKDSDDTFNKMAMEKFSDKNNYGNYKHFRIRKVCI